ncbi:uncharacterized protein RHOBADRAFT_53552 [Rhodotorula graminis WP1]|uniref:Ubiquitin-like domain-containing protein n=1 Tax=Rhodotorula graminis (strain WP1) TaxID=578459 RepID=A0A194S4Y6_RHOGW|nr:uncharacterized protein RHOBADRAFT_53552 [Rhodotorula graminis WP1]KPV75589.1 hypothetical protein RHOBADRAFT_53552 [Rhodotorula graminis WP1]
MESLLSDTRLPEEIQSFKATAELLATLKQRYPNSYIPPVEERHKRPTLVNVPVCPPPTTGHDDDDDEPMPAADATVKLTVKSLKPALSFTLAARPTATVADLKKQLAAAEKDAPAPEQQRWILKGKAMGDGKLLREFDVQDGAVVNLMITKAPAAAAAPSSSTASAASPSSPGVPALTLSEPSTSSSSTAPQVSLAKDLDALPLSTSSTSPAHPEHAGLSPAFLSSVASPALWQSVRDTVEGHFEGNKEAQRVWEAMFEGAQEWIRPNDKALIRERVGYSAMGGV